MSQHDTQRIIEEFLGDRPRADEWRVLRQALEERLANTRRLRQQEHSAAPGSERESLYDKQIADLDRQLAALETEEAVAKFVEETLSYIIGKNQVSEHLGDEEYTAE